MTIFYRFSLLSFVMLAASPAFLLAGRSLAVPESDGRVNVNVFAAESLFASLDAGASVYCCRVASVIPTKPKASDGRVTVAIKETLLGTPANQLDLPYSAEDPNYPIMGRSASHIWPYLDGLPADTLFLIVVLPNSYDRTAPQYPDVHQAATHVFVCSKGGPDLYAIIKRVCVLHKFDDGGDPDKHLSKLAEATTDENEQVRRYAVDALMNGFANKSPDKVFEALKGQLTKEHLVLTVTGEADQTLSQIRRAVNEGQSAEERKAALKVLASICTKSEDSDIEDSAVKNLAVAVATNSFNTSSLVFTLGVARPVIPAHDVLSDDEISGLHARLTSLANDNPVLVRVISQWLDGTAPPFSTTQP